MWKVDFAKAFDSVEWKYLWASMKCRHFPSEWIQWVKQCVTSHSFSILVNGRPEGGWIQPQRGVRQGCPLAPLLFIIAADALACFTNQVCARGMLRGFQTECYTTGIPLLRYADDTVFFIEGVTQEAKMLSILLNLFVDFSRLQLNHTKSSLIKFGLTRVEERQCS